MLSNGVNNQTQCFKGYFLDAVACLKILEQTDCCSGFRQKVSVISAERSAALSLEQKGRVCLVNARSGLKKSSLLVI